MKTDNFASGYCKAKISNICNGEFKLKSISEISN